MSKINSLLICEDDKSLSARVIEAIKDRYQTEGIDMEIFSVHDKPSALKLIEDRFFSVALVDLNLSEMMPLDWSQSDGIDVIQKINKKEFGTKIMVVSANPMTSLSFDLGKDYGISDYIMKGSSITSFTDIINSLLRLSKASDIPKSSSPIEDFIGISGEKKIVLERVIGETIFLLKSQQDSIIQKIINAIYPCEYRRGDRVIIDSGFKYVNAILWSYRYSSFVGVRIQKKDDLCQESIDLFESNINEEIFSKEQYGTSIQIFTLDM